MRIRLILVFALVLVLGGCQSGGVHQGSVFHSSSAQTGWLVFGVDYGSQVSILPRFIWRRYDAKTGKFDTFKIADPPVGKGAGLGAFLLGGGYTASGFQNKSVYIVVELDPGDYFLQQVVANDGTAFGRDGTETNFKSGAPKFRIASGQAIYLGRIGFSKKSFSAPKFSFDKIPDAEGSTNAQNALYAKVKNAPKISAAKISFVKFDCGGGVLGLGDTCKVK